MKDDPPSAEIFDSSAMVTLHEAARLIRACVRTVYRLIDEGELPRPIKIRSRSFLPRVSVLDYLVRQGMPLQSK